MANVHTTIVTHKRLQPRDTAVWEDQVIPLLEAHGYETDSEADGSWWIGASDPCTFVEGAWPGIVEDEIIDVIAKHTLSGSMMEVSTCKLRDVGGSVYVFEDGIYHHDSLHQAMKRLVMSLHGRL